MARRRRSFSRMPLWMRSGPKELSKAREKFLEEVAFNLVLDLRAKGVKSEEGCVVSEMADELWEGLSLIERHGEALRKILPLKPK